MECNEDKIFKKNLQLNNSLDEKYSLIKPITTGLSESKVLLVSDKNDNKFILKIGLINDENIKELLISCSLQNHVRSMYFPKIFDYGFTNYVNPYNKSGDPKLYLYIVMEYIEGYTLKDAIINKKIKSQYVFKKIMKNLIEAYILANRKIGFYHWDIKGDNIIIRKNDIPVIIDYGHSFTKKYNPDLWIKFKRDFYVKLSKHYLPEKNIRSRQFDKTLQNYKYLSPEDQRLKKINIKYVDIVNLIKLINTGQRMLFNENQILLDDTDIKYLNQPKLPFYQKLEYLLDLPYFKLR